MDDRKQFQGKCLQSMEGWEFMPHFDDLPWEVRNEMRNSPFNLCPACVIDIAHKFGGHDSYYKAIREMEAQIRCEEVPQAQ